MKSHLFSHHPTAPVVVREPPPAEAVGRWSAGFLLGLHGAVHGMGLVLLWRLAEPGTLRYTDAAPDPGTAAGYLAGAGWLTAGVAFVVGAFLLVRRDHRWLPVTTAAAIVSLLLISLMAAQAPVGVAVDAVTLVICAALWIRRDRLRAAA